MLTGLVSDGDVILAGDVLYDEELASIVLPWLRRLVKERRCEVYIGGTPPSFDVVVAVNTHMFFTLSTFVCCTATTRSRSLGSERNESWGKKWVI